MSDVDLDAVGLILAPLDLIPILQVPSGDLLTGLTGREPAVHVRGVHAAAFGASLGPGRSTPALDVELLDFGMLVRLRSLSPRRFADGLLAHDVDLIEEIHAPFAFHGESRLIELRRIVAPLLGRETIRRMRERGEEVLRAAGEDVRKPARGLLAALRWFLSGLHLAETGEVRPRLADLAEWCGEGWLRELAGRPGAEALAGSPGRIGFWLGEIETLRERLVEAEARAPVRNPDDLRRRLDGWCGTWGQAPAG